MKKTAIKLFIIFLSTNSFGQTSKEFVESGNKKYQDYDWKGAINDYSSAIKLDSSNATAYSSRGSVKAFKLKDYKGACLDWKKAAYFGDDKSKTFFQTFCN